MFNRVSSYIRSVKERDPATRSGWDILLCNPGVHAIGLHRVSHWLWNKKLGIPARMLGMFARWITGIEIHPAAKIGKNCYIDHGMGVVIGETSSIGNNVTLYHGVTLGGTSWDHGVRHPQVEDDVVIGAGAKVLGPVILGRGSRVGANAVVVKSVAEGKTVIGIPARAVEDNVGTMAEYEPHFSAYGTPTGDVQDPLIEELKDEIKDLKSRLNEKDADEREEEMAAVWSMNRDTKH